MPNVCTRCKRSWSICANASRPWSRRCSGCGRGKREVSGMQYLSVVLMCIIAAVFYGVAHDQITARICVEYFPVGHPPIFPTKDPTLLGLGKVFHANACGDLIV